MGISPFKFLFRFFIFSIILWLFFKFASRLLGLILSRTMGATIRCRYGGWASLKDIDFKFKKGGVESVSVAEIRLRLCLKQSLAKQGTGFFSKEPKLQILASNLEVVTRPSKKGSRKSKPRKSSTSGKRPSGKGKWIAMSMARFLSVSFKELNVKVPKADIEIKELNVDISKDAEPKQALFFKLHLMPIVVQLRETGNTYDQSSSSNGDGFTSSDQESSSLTGRTSASFCCEEFFLLSEFGYDREAGIVIKNLVLNCGETSLNLDEELLAKKKSPPDASSLPAKVEASSATDNKSEEKEKKAFSLTKYTAIIPEKLSFSLPKLDVNFVHNGLDLVMENYIMGLQVKSIKSQSTEDVGENTRLDFQMEFGEIHLAREASISVLEIVKLAIVSTSYIPLQPTSPIRSEVDIKLGGTRCNIIMSRINPWLQLKPSKKKSMVLQTGNSHPARVQAKKPKMILWTLTVSAPEMVIILYSLEGSPLYHGCLQSSHVFGNNISSTGTSVHIELGEVNLLMADEYQGFLKESVFGVETNAGTLIHINKISLDWGKKDLGSPEEGALRSKSAVSVDVAGICIFITLKRVESIISTAMSFKSLFKKGSSAKKQPQTQGSSSKASGKGIQLINVNLERCCVVISGELGLDNTVVPDPKRVNYGSQGSRVVVSVLADGTERSAKIMSTQTEDVKKIKYSLSLDIFNLGLSMNKEKQYTQVVLKRAQSVYQEFMEDKKPGEKVQLLVIQNVKFVRRTGSIKEIDICSLFSSSDITIRWEPDAHLALLEFFLRVELSVHNQKIKGLDEKPAGEIANDGGNEQKTESATEPVNEEKQKKKRESLFAVDVEMLNITAAVGDGVEAAVQVQSIFSENASIGVLLEGLTFRFNEARIFRSGRAQISRIPNVSSGPPGTKHETTTSWDWIIQGLDLHVCLPFRLQLRAIDDAVEDMLRALKLISAAKTKLIFPVKKESPKKVKKKSSKIGCVKFSIRKLTFEIEEEPLQGWLDEHYRLMKNEAHELAVRLKFLEDIVSKCNSSPPNDENKGMNNDSMMNYNGEEIDLRDALGIQKMKEEIYKQSFRNYYSACQKLVPSEGSGACGEGFQAGFKPSASRTSLFSVSARDLDVCLTRIEGGDAGMIEVIQKLDPVSRVYNIPFSKLYGSNILLRTGSLVVQIRNYTHPLLLGTSGRCEGRLVLAQQATRFQPQITQDVFVGRWMKVCMCRSATGTTPPVKSYLDLPLHFQKAEVSFGVGYEPSFADLSYAFSVALRRANLSIRKPGPYVAPPKKERSLPWWDDMRNYIHGKVTINMSESRFHVLATTDPYEKSEKLQITSGHMEIQQSDGRVYCSAKDFKIFLSSLENLLKNSDLKLPQPLCFFAAPSFIVEVTMDWGCDSGNPMNHYLFTLPNEGALRNKIFDPFRSTSLSLRWDISLGSTVSSCDIQSQSSTIGKDTITNGAKMDNVSNNSPEIVLGAHDLKWMVKFWNILYLPPHKLRAFSRWPRFGVPRIPRSGNLSLDRVMTEFMLRVDITPTLIRNMPMDDDDPAKGLSFKMEKLKFEFCYSRGKQNFTFETKRDPLDLVYLGLDLHMPKLSIIKDDGTSVANLIQMKRKSFKSLDRTTEKSGSTSSHAEKHRDDGFFLSSDYFTIRKQAPKADPEALLAWQESGRRDSEMTYIRSEFEKGSESDEHTRSDPSDDEGDNVVVADNCQRISVYGLKLLWTLENRDAVWSWIGGLSKAVRASKASPSRQYAQRKLLENKQVVSEPEKSAGDISSNPANTQVPAAMPTDEKLSIPVNSQVSASVPTDEKSANPVNSQVSASVHVDDKPSNPVSTSTPVDDKSSNPVSTSTPVDDKSSDPVSTSMPAADKSSDPVNNQVSESSPEVGEVAGSLSSPPRPVADNSPFDKVAAKDGSADGLEEEGTRHFMVNIIEPQFNLHSEEANGRFLLAAVSGRVLAQSFHSVLRVGYEVIEKALGTENIHVPESQPEMTWKRMEFSVMLEHVQAHVAPTDVDPGAGLQWLPKIRRSSPKVKRTGALLERVFMPCDMYFQYRRHKAGTEDLKMKPLKELTFNSHNITATMTSRQFRVMLDVLTNLLFARPPKPRKSKLLCTIEDEEEVEEESDQVVPDGVEEVELAKIDLERKEWEQKVLLDDIRNLSLHGDISGDECAEKAPDLWMIISGRPTLVHKLKKELVDAKRSRKVASASLRKILHEVAAIRLIEKEKNKTPSCAMRVCMKMNKIVWSMFADGKSFAEAEINDMIYDFDRDYKDIGIARFTMKYFVIRNCQPNAKFDMMLSPWNPPSEWGKKVMLRVDARQGAPKDGNSPIESFLVEIYPLRIHLTETIYQMIWGYFFPEEEQDSQRRQDIWKVSTTAGLKKVKKGSSSQEAPAANSRSSKELEVSSKTNKAASGSQPPDSNQGSKLPKAKGNLIKGSKPELRRTSSLDRSWEETLAESVAEQLVLELEEPTKGKSKEAKTAKGGRSTNEDKKVAKAQEEKRPRPKKFRDFHNVKISQVELLVTYEGLPFSVSELRLLMDTFYREDFTGTWSRLFSRVKKHVIWGVLKSVTGMQGKKFKDKAHAQRLMGTTSVPELSDSDEGSPTKPGAQYPILLAKRPGDGAGDGFVTSIRGLFTRRRKAKAFVLRTMRGEDGNEFQGDWSESDSEFSPFARQLSVTKAKKLIRRHTKKFRSRGHRASSSQLRDSLPSSPRELNLETDSSNESPPEDLRNAFRDERQPGK